MMFRAITGLALSLFTLSCVSNTDGIHAETGAVCDQAGLESQLVSLNDRSKQIRAGIGLDVKHVSIGLGAQRNNTGPSSRLYQLRDKMKEFEAEIDAQFRNVTSSCKAFSRCMQKNDYKESACGMTMIRWNTAEDTFKDLSTELRALEVEAKKITASGPVDLPHPPLPPHDTPKPPSTCCSTLNNIFTDCCDGN